MAWWVYLIVILTLVVFSEILKRSKFGWVVKIGESAAYVAEQMGIAKNLSGEEKMRIAIETFRKLSKDMGVNWLTKWIPDDVIKNVIESVVGKMNWNKKITAEPMNQKEFNKDMDNKIHKFLGTSETEKKLKEDLNK